MIILAGLSGDEGRACLDGGGRNGRKVEVLRGDATDLSVDAVGSVDGPATGDDVRTIAFPLTLGDVAGEGGVAGSETAAGAGEDTSGGDRDGGVGVGLTRVAGTGTSVTAIGGGSKASTGFSTSFSTTISSGPGSDDGFRSCLRWGRESIMDTGR